MLDISNYYERLVVDQIWKLTEQSEEIWSQNFVDDVACLTLNQLPACYVRNPVDKVLNLSAQESQAMVAAVEQAIMQAIKQVQSRPHDNRED